jgi:FAD/FMN-containing dehydrogenase
MKIIHLRVKTFAVSSGQDEVENSRIGRKRGARPMTPISSIARAAAEIGEAFSGKLLQPTDAGYDEARKVHNGLIDKRPALIARCRNPSDVAIAVNLAQRSGLETAVRGGGHNVAGRATIDGGLMIDVSPMKEIVVEPKQRIARVEGGVTWAELNRETQAHGLAVTGGVVSSTGVAGLTLGGGLGWLMGKHGLALDNLRSVELVTAAGEQVRASADEQPDLFWALRGGGGNFGVATSFEFQLHPVGPAVTGGRIVHQIQSARDLFKFFRGAAVSLPDEQTIVGGLIHAPDGSGTKLSALVTCHCGSLAAGERAMRPLRQFGSPAVDALGVMPYCELNTMMDAGYPKGALNYWKSSFLATLSDEAIDTMIACFAKCPTPMGQIILEHVHGAATRVAVGDTAFPHRAAGYNFLLIAQWLDPEISERCIAWARETYAAMQPFTAKGRYVNYLGDDETGDDPVAAAYGPNYRRLQRIKSKYDPKNFFRMNQNVRPLA